MRKNIKKSMMAAALTLVIAGTSVVPSGATSDLENQQQSIQNEIESNQQQQNDAKLQLEDIEDQISKLADEISKYDSSISQKDAEIEDLNQKMDEKQAEIDEIQADYDKQYEDMKLRIQYIYENGDSQILELLLTSDGFGDFLNKAQYFSDIVQYDRNMLDKMEQTRVALENAKSDLQNQKDTAVATLEGMKADRQTVMALKQEQNDLYAQVEDELYALASAETNLNERLDGIESEIKAYEEEQERLREEEERRQQEQNNSSSGSTESNNSGGDSTESNNSGGDSTKPSTPPSPSVDYGSSSYGWIWPAPGCYGINDYFGWRTDPVGFHHGIDLQTGYGTPYVSVADGYVAFAGWSDSLGNYVMVDHGGIMTFYAHSSVLYVSTGQKVSQGEVMGLTGNTGYSFGAHLHFAVYLNGEFVDPLPYLP